MSRGTVAAGVLLLSLTATAARAQSLADAAAKAEAQRKATGKATKTYSDESLLEHDGYESLVADRYLLEQHWDAYSHARGEIAGYRISDTRLDERLVQIEMTGNRYALEKTFRSDPKLSAVLSRFNLSARDYFMADASLDLAGADLQQSWNAQLALTESRKANLDFVRHQNLYPPYYENAPWNGIESQLRYYRRTP